METCDVNWDERPEHQPIEYKGESCQVCEGCEVSLEHNGERITARVVQCAPGEPSVGQVTGFPGNATERIGELTIGCTILFWDRHVFSCAA